jgi:hypothetical protein
MTRVKSSYSEIFLPTEGVFSLMQSGRYFVKSITFLLAASIACRCFATGDK